MFYFFFIAIIGRQISKRKSTQTSAYLCKVFQNDVVDHSDRIDHRYALDSCTIIYYSRLKLYFSIVMAEVVSPMKRQSLDWFRKENKELKRRRMHEKEKYAYTLYIYWNECVYVRVRCKYICIQINIKKTIYKIRENYVQ